MNKKQIFDIIIAFLAMIVMLLLGFILPLFGTLLLLLLPLPSIILFVRYDIQTALLFILLIAIVLALFLSPVFFIIIIINIGLIAIVMGSAIKENFSGFKIFLVGVIASFISLLLILAISIYIFDVDIIAFLTENLEQMADMAELNQIVDDTVVLEELFVETIEIIKVIFPSFFITLSLVITAINYYAATLFLTELEVKDNSFLVLKKFKLPRIILVLFIFALVTIDFIISKNILLIVTFLLVVQGIGILYWYFENKIQTSLLIFILLTIIILPMINPFLLFLGLLDVAIDLRNLAKKN